MLKEQPRKQATQSHCDSEETSVAAIEPSPSYIQCHAAAKFTLPFTLIQQNSKPHG